MCSVCNQFPCPVGCPEKGSQGLYTCAICEDGICNGERYYKVNGEYFHRDCLLDSYDKDELLQLLKGPGAIATDLVLLCYRRKG